MSDTYILTAEEIENIAYQAHFEAEKYIAEDKREEAATKARFAVKWELASIEAKRKTSALVPASGLVRPSSLPKLACCRAYVGASGMSEAAARGTKLDAAIRQAWITLHALNPDPQTRRLFPGLSKDDEQACDWAISRMIELAGEAHLETDEANLQAVVPVEGVQPGTMDGLCVERCFLIDYKTGQVRDYKAQMAAYALACMETYFADSWTAHLLFIDQEQVVTHHFTIEEARAIVEGIVKAPIVPTACDYCGWCLAYGLCPATRWQIAKLQETAATLPACTSAAKSIKPLPPALEELASNERLAYIFLKHFALAKDWSEVIKREIKNRLIPTGQNKTDFFQLVTVSDKRYVSASGLIPWLEAIGIERLLAACPLIPFADAQALWKEVFGDKDFPSHLITSAAGGNQLRLRKVDASLLTDTPPTKTN